MTDLEGNPLTQYLKNIEDLGSKTILDIGAGPYQPMEDAYARFTDHQCAERKVVSLDRDYGWAINPNSAVRASAEQLPFGENSFDIVSMISLLHTLEQEDLTKSALSEVSRVLVPGGIFIVGNVTLKPKVGDGFASLKVLWNLKKHNNQMENYRKEIQDNGFDVTDEWKSLNWGAVLANFMTVN